MKKLTIILLLSFLFISKAYADNYNKLKNTPTSLLEHRTHLLEHELEKESAYVILDKKKERIRINFFEEDACRIATDWDELTDLIDSSPTKLKSLGEDKRFMLMNDGYYCGFKKPDKDYQKPGCFNVEELTEMCGAKINYFIEDAKRNLVGGIIYRAYGLDINDRADVEARYYSDFDICGEDKIITVSCKGTISEGYNAISYRITKD